MRQNTHICAALNMALYFFGHNGTTAIEQEAQTGLVTGLGDYILKHAPQAASMPPASYDDLFMGPWATNKELEITHRELSKSIGESLRGNALSFMSTSWKKGLWVSCKKGVWKM